MVVGISTNGLSINVSTGFEVVVLALIIDVLSLIFTTGIEIVCVVDGSFVSFELLNILF